DFENIPRMDLAERSKIFKQYLTYMGFDDYQSYRVVGKSGCNSEMKLDSLFGERFISYVSNDYLGFTQHPEIKASAIRGIEEYGTGAGASPLIGGFFDYHRLLEKKIDRKSTRLNSSHVKISYAVFCLK